MILSIKWKLKKIYELIKSLRNQYEIKNEQIEICSFYKEQIKFIKEDLVEKIDIQNLHIDTIDSFQGQERDFILILCVRTNGNIEFLEDKNRLNVAITRARQGIIF